MTRLLHKALRDDPSGEGLDFYNVYKQNVEQAPVSVIRDMLEVVSDREPIDISQVEPAEKIM